MKKTSKFFTLLVGLVVMFSGIAKAEGFSVGADVVSRYIWRGTQFGEGIAVQPSLSYTFPGIGVEVGVWGSYDLNDDSANEVDPYLTVPLGEYFSFTVTDYYFPTLPGADTDVFNYDDGSAHFVELSAGFEYENLSLLAGVFVTNDDDNSKYFEADYNFYDKDDYSASLFVGAGDGIYTTDADFDLVNVGITASKDIFSASYIVNPEQETSWVVFGVTLEP